MSTPRKIETGTLGVGVVLIVVGAMMLADRFTPMDMGDVIRQYWPTFIIAVALPKLATGSTFWGGLWLIAVGSWLQAVNLHLYGMTYSNSWPLLLIALGGGMIVRALVEAVSRKEENHG